MKDYFFGARTPDEDVNAEDEVGLNKHLRIMIRYVFLPGTRSWWWRRPWYIWKELGAYGGEGVEEGRSSAEERCLPCRRSLKALGDDWPRKSADLLLIGVASEE
ncbi:hypothetical protein AMECASPLE_034542 [Ameca splendens]|uniref:Uncharacterized protein n=1 Tax=Ameca splendens TaxID=208324 RepID=A0ABV0Y7S3_9TELE